MKKLALSMLLVIGLLFSAMAVFAQTVYTYPADDPVFAIAFPDDWDVELEADEAGVIAVSPDEEIEINIWPLDADDVADDVEAALMAAAEEIDIILAEYVTDFEASDPEVIEINGITFVEIAGSATYLEDDSEATISVNFFSPDGETVFALIYWGNPESDDYFMEDLAAIINSVQAP